MSPIAENLIAASEQSTVASSEEMSIGPKASTTLSRSLPLFRPVGKCSGIIGLDELLQESSPSASQSGQSESSQVESQPIATFETVPDSHNSLADVLGSVFHRKHKIRVRFLEGNCGENSGQCDVENGTKGNAPAKSSERWSATCSGNSSEVPCRVVSATESVCQRINDPTIFVMEMKFNGSGAPPSLTSQEDMDSFIQRAIETATHMPRSTRDISLFSANSGLASRTMWTWKLDSEQDVVTTLTTFAPGHPVTDALNLNFGGAA